MKSVMSVEEITSGNELEYFFIKTSVGGEQYYFSHSSRFCFVKDRLKTFKKIGHAKAALKNVTNYIRYINNAEAKSIVDFLTEAVQNAVIVSSHFGVTTMDELPSTETERYKELATKAKQSYEEDVERWKQRRLNPHIHISN
jgi:hypothetical protein